MPSKPLVGIIMGSKTDLEILQGAVEVEERQVVEESVRFTLPVGLRSSTGPRPEAVPTNDGTE